MPDETARMVRFVKTAVVAKAVKQYRRALEALQGGNLFHGTKPGLVAPIAQQGVIQPNVGTHGTGAYFWRDRPLSTYMRYPDYPGILTSRKGVKMGPAPIDPNPPGTHTNPGLVSDRAQMEISSTPVQLAQGKATTISANPKDLRAALDAIKEKRYRQMDTRVFHRAEADRAMAQMDRIEGTEHMQRPTKQELVRLLRGKMPAHRVGMTRKIPTRERDINQLYGTYDRAIGRKPQRGPDGEFDYV